jgi:hypothetical protein
MNGNTEIGEKMYYLAQRGILEVEGVAHENFDYRGSKSKHTDWQVRFHVSYPVDLSWKVNGRDLDKILSDLMDAHKTNEEIFRDRGPEF